MNRQLSKLGMLLAAGLLGCATATTNDGSGSIGNDPNGDSSGDTPADGVGRAFDCPETPAPDIFAASMCVCEDFGDIGNLLIGTSVAGDTAVAAINGKTTFANNARIKGDLIAYEGLVAATNLNIENNFISAGEVKVAGNVSVDGDMEVGGDLKGAGRLAVDGTLRVAGNNTFLGFRDIGELGDYATTPEPPCGCDPATFFDVNAAVEEARNQNDNATLGLATDFNNIGASDVRLTSGTYFFTDLDNVGFTRMEIDGVVAMYVDGSVDNIGAERIKLTAGSTLDLYVSGAVRNVGHINLGDKNAPSAFRLYIGGTDTCTLSVGNARFSGAIYAPEAELKYVGNTEIRGAVFARRLTGVGNMTIGYAAPLESPDTCEPNNDPGDPGDPDGQPGDGDPNQPDQPDQPDPPEDEPPIIIE